MKSERARVIITNFKGHFRYTNSEENKRRVRNLTSGDKCSVKHHANFTVLKSEFTFVVFWTAGFVNVTKVRRLDQLNTSVVREFGNITGIFSANSPIVDSIHAKGSVTLTHPLRTLHESAIQLGFNAELRPSYFSGLIVRSAEGTLIVFQSGKYFILGSKTVDNTEKVSDLLCVNILPHLSPLKGR